MANGVDAVVQLAEKLKAPVCNTYLHNDSFPRNHELWMGPLGYQVRIHFRMCIDLCKMTHVYYSSEIISYIIMIFISGLQSSHENNFSSRCSISIRKPTWAIWIASTIWL